MADDFLTTTLSHHDFQILQEFIYRSIGIKIHDFKRGMVESRLRKRLSILKFETFSDYCAYLFSERGQREELSEFIDVITTNKTDFFREPDHFTYLVNSVLPDVISSIPSGLPGEIRVWSCACSRGHEPYTLAMVLSEFSRSRTSFRYSILASDISRKVLKTAVAGIYDEEDIEPVPMDLRKRYILRSRERTRRIVRIKPELRRKIDFRQINLMADDYELRQKIHILFCRNVMIYFDKPTTRRLVEKLCDTIVPGGYLFVGHSEVLEIGGLPLVSPAPAVYRKVD
jgi:chemotaxis protein methyltransferase CheR